MPSHLGNSLAQIKGDLAVADQLIWINRGLRHLGMGGSIVVESGLGQWQREHAWRRS